MNRKTYVPHQPALVFLLCLISLCAGAQTQSARVLSNNRNNDTLYRGKRNMVQIDNFPPRAKLKFQGRMQVFSNGSLELEIKNDYPSDTATLTLTLDDLPIYTKHFPVSSAPGPYLVISGLSGNTATVQQLRNHHQFRIVPESFGCIIDSFQVLLQIGRCPAYEMSVIHGSTLTPQSSATISKMHPDDHLFICATARCPSSSYIVQETCQTFKIIQPNNDGANR